MHQKKAPPTGLTRSFRRNNFCLKFRDAVAIRYNWEPQPNTCPYNENFTLGHAQCAKGGYTDLRDGEIRDTFIELLEKFCHDVETEPHLMPLQGASFDSKSTSTDDNVRLDIKVNGLWGLRVMKRIADQREEKRNIRRHYCIRPDDCQFRSPS